MDIQQLTIRGHLQNVSMKYSSAELINTQIAHLLPMPTRKAKVLTYNRGDQFRDEAKPRERGTEAARVDLKYSMADVNTYPMALKALITDEDLEDEGLPGGTVPPVNMQQDALELVAWKLDLSREIKLANKIFTTTWADGVAATVRAALDTGSLSAPSTAPDMTGGSPMSKMADDVKVENRRLDASDNEALIGMARMGADAFGYKAELRIDRQLAQRPLQTTSRGD